LAFAKFEGTESTGAAWATHWQLPHAEQTDNVEREIWLWDFAGQVDYRLVHQLFMDEAAAAVLVFNPQSENPFEGLGRWDRDLQKAARKPFAKLLAAGRVDRGALVVSNSSIQRFMNERGFVGSLHLTSAKTGEGCDQLREAIIQAIDWSTVPTTASPALYHRIKQGILRLRESGIVLLRLVELKQRMELALPGEHFALEQLENVVSLLARPGFIQRLDFGGFILLRPEVISGYAAAVVRKVRMHPQEMGCIREDELLAGNLDYQDLIRLPSDDEAVVLRTLLETFIRRAWCLRQPTDDGVLLIFPSYLQRERPEQQTHPKVLVTYRFTGPADEIYATLVVRLQHTGAFDSAHLWRFAADFQTQTGTGLGLKLTRESEGTSRIEVYFEPEVDENSRVLFLRYVHDHLSQHAGELVRVRHYTCLNKACEAFQQPFPDQNAINSALSPAGKGSVFCPYCGIRIVLSDIVETKFTSQDVKEEARRLQLEGQIVLDNESRELVLVGHVSAVAGEAGQIYRGYTNSDHGLDGEIEFKDDAGRASGKRVYLQLKSGDSYLKKRKRDGAEIFQIKNERWATYWQEQPYHVMLVIRTTDGQTRWMDVSEYLKRVGDKRAIRQIVFAGEPLTAYSLRSYRDKVLGAPRRNEEARRRPKQFHSEQGPLRVRHMAIENLRGIENLRIEFSSTETHSGIRAWTILLGENGTGKSTVLRSLALVLSGREGCVQLLGDPSNWLRNGANEGSISVALEAQAGRIEEIHLDIQRGMTAVDVVRDNQGLEWLDDAIDLSAHNCFVAGYGVTRRPATSRLALSQQTSPGFVLGPRAQAVASLFTSDIVLHPLDEWAMDLHYRLGEPGLELLREAFQGLLPKTYLKCIDKDRRELLFDTVDGIVPLSLLSDGYQNMIGWCGDLLFRITQAFEGVKNPFSVRGILLIDEMDLHLHPVWQRQLLAFLTERLPGFQIVATTHSPFTALQAGPGELHLLERLSAESSPTVRRFDGTPRHMRLEDLAISPWFGLKTSFSFSVERLKDEYEARKQDQAVFPEATRAVSAAQSSASEVTSTPEVELQSVFEGDPRNELEKQNRLLISKLQAVIDEKKSEFKNSAKRGRRRSKGK
jgi:hypothetical protein